MKMLFCKGEEEANSYGFEVFVETRRLVQNVPMVQKLLMLFLYFADTSKQQYQLLYYFCIHICVLQRHDLYSFISIRFCIFRSTAHVYSIHFYTVGEFPVSHT